MEEREIQQGIYRHFKGADKLYEVIGIANHTESGEKLVIYKNLYETEDKPYGTIWARPEAMFLEKVPEGRENPNNQTYRFEYIGEAK